MDTTNGLWDVLPVVLGPFIGSFLGLVSIRLPKGESIVGGRSGCRSCERALQPLDLIPILSFAGLRGRCRGCAVVIPIRYPLMEAGCLALGLWSALVFSGPLALVTAALGWTLLLIAVIDAEHFWLPEILTLPLAAAGLIVSATHGFAALRDALIGGAAGFLVLAIIGYAYRRLRGREGLGGGDLRLLGAAGAWVGWIGLPSVLLYAALLGLCLALAARLRGGPISGTTPLPFGTFLAVGLWITWLYGPLGRG